MKVCSRCRIEKSEHEFGRDRSRRDGRSYVCFTCGRARRREEKHRDYAENPRKYLDRDKARREANLEVFRARERERARRYRAANPQKYRDRFKAWYSSGPHAKELLRSAHRNYMSRTGKAVAKRWATSEHGRAVRRLHHAKRRALKLGATAPTPKETLLRKLLYYKALGEEPCAYCGKVRDSYHVDHIVPLSRGGADTPENLANACVECNLKKHAQLGWVTRDGRKGAYR